MTVPPVSLRRTPEDRSEDDDFPVVCGNGCPDGYLGQHKMSCHWAGGRWFLDGTEVLITGDSALLPGASGLVCTQEADRALQARAVANYSCPFCGRNPGRGCTRVEATYSPPLPDLIQPHENRVSLARGESTHRHVTADRLVRR
jgi:hypothetical protein